MRSGVAFPVGRLCRSYLTRVTPAPARGGHRLVAGLRRAGVLLLAWGLVGPVWTASAQVVHLLIDEDSIDNGRSAIEQISFNSPFCGAGNSAVCVNDDIADPGVRTLLFTRGHDVTGLTDLRLPTGQVGDEGLFRFSRPDPQRSKQNRATFTITEFFAATGAAADENNLDKIAGVLPLRRQDVEDLLGRTVCAVVFDSDISVDVPAKFASLKGATLGLTAFTVTDVRPQPSRWLVSARDHRGPAAVERRGHDVSRARRAGLSGRAATEAPAGRASG
jgi:hypothetical protein